MKAEMPVLEIVVQRGRWTVCFFPFLPWGIRAEPHPLMRDTRTWAIGPFELWCAPAELA